MNRISTLLVGCVVLIAGCASPLKPYNASAPQNFHLSASMDSGVSAGVDIYSVSKTCELQYLGSVALDDGSADLGLPVGAPSYLVIRFTRSSFWSSQSSTMSQETLILAEKGFRYEMRLSYVDSIYDIQLTRINVKTGDVSKMASDTTACSSQ